MQLNIVYSVGKTASTSLFTSWGSQPECLPVVHTHDLKFFCVVDRADSAFTRNIFENHRSCVFGVRVPAYLAAGPYTEFRFSLADGLRIPDAFPATIFSTTKIIGVLRHPVSRRISQFLNNTTVESVNAYIDANRIRSEHVSRATIVADLRRTAALVTSHSMLTDLAAIVTSTGRLPRAGELEPIFEKFFCGRDMDEYVSYFSRLDGLFPGKIDLASIRRGGEQEVKHNDMHLLLVKMESMAAVDRSIKQFTGINRDIRHDRKIKKECHFVDGSLSEVKGRLASRFHMSDMYPPGSAEMSLVKELGYF